MLCEFQVLPAFIHREFKHLHQEVSCTSGYCGLSNLSFLVFLRLARIIVWQGFRGGLSLYLLTVPTFKPLTQVLIRLSELPELETLRISNQEQVHTAQLAEAERRKWEIALKHVS